jgi:phosphoenolpyruvate synthase/pyruvate phosphate dikinase
LAFRKIAKLLELTDSSDIFYLSPDEIIDCLDLSRKPSLELIKERRAGYMVYSSKDRMIVISGKELKVLKQSIQIFEKIDEGLVKGQTAYPGKVRGKVVVIGSKTELGKVQKDNILITTSTTVDYIPYLKKVKAIVADEGPLLSHASVISRELRIPCIIGTGHGTYSFKDGDEVEVDTEKGVVRILNK